jgi:hypothetical protein
MKKLLLLAYLLTVYTVNTAQTTITFQPSVLNITTTGQFAVEVWVNNVNALYAASITINFNSERLNYISVSQGNFLSGAFQYVTSPSPGNPNSIKVDQAILGGGSVSGSGKVFTIYFTPKSPGTDVLTVSAADLENPGGGHISFTTQNCNINVNLPVIAGAKVFLQGAFNSSSGNMNNNLCSSFLIPLLQPFSGPPWNYSGTENVTTTFYKVHKSIVDWVLIELRTGLAGSSVAARKAAFLMQDGSIIDTDGSTSLKFNLAAGSYYIVIRQRNHLAVMSSSTVPLTINSNAWDFTTSQSKAYGTNSLSALSSGVFGMIAGDNNQDGYIDISDFIGVDNNMFQSGYQNSDINMDGYIDISDFIMIDNNMFHGCSIPN